MCCHSSPRREFWEQGGLWSSEKREQQRAKGIRNIMPWRTAGGKKLLPIEVTIAYPMVEKKMPAAGTRSWKLRHGEHTLLCLGTTRSWFPESLLQDAVNTQFDGPFVCSQLGHSPISVWWCEHLTWWGITIYQLLRMLWLLLATCLIKPIIWQWNSGCLTSFF